MQSAKGRKANLWEYDRKKKKVRCLACAKRCLIGRNELGYCKVRKNIGKQLITLNYGKILVMDTKSIEALPMYNFLPGANVLTISCLGTNLRGKIGYAEGYEKKLEGIKVRSVDYVISKAEKEKVNAIAFLGTNESDPFVYPEFAYKC